MDDNNVMNDSSRYDRPKHWRAKYIWKQFHEIIIVGGVILGLILAFLIGFLVRYNRHWSQEKEALQNLAVGQTVAFGIYGEKAEWLVLAEENGHFLLLSKNIMTVSSIDSDEKNQTSWEACELRENIGDYYLERWFLDREQVLLAETKLPEGTTDRVFLLSKEELEAYVPTEARVAYDEEGKVYTWWLRTPGTEVGMMSVNAGGYVNEAGSETNDSTIALRMACWIDPSMILK